MFLLGDLHLGENISSDLDPDLLLQIFLPELVALEPPPQPGDRVVAGPPGIRLVVGPIREAVIAGTMVRDSVVHELEQDGPATVFERPTGAASPWSPCTKRRCRLHDIVFLNISRETFWMCHYVGLYLCR